MKHIPVIFSVSWRSCKSSLSALTFFVLAQGTLPLAQALAATAQTAPVTDFRPGEIWMDTAGHPINAHGGGMLFHNGVYYWYGENKEGRTWLPESTKSWDGYRVDVTGIRCYSSTNLLDWQDRGLVLKAVPDNPAHDLHPSKVCERPKVVFNALTKKFVMWMHIDSEDYEAARAGVAIADEPTGPFTYLASVRPEGQGSQDQTVFQDDDGKAYRIYASERDDTTYISLLTDDYLKHSGKFVRVFVKRRMEAQAVFKHAGKYWLIASDCTGWDPNPARSAVAQSIWGPWTELGNPCRGPDADRSFGGQSAFVFPVAGRKDAFILMADRWNKTNLPESRYLWLPIQFRDDKCVVEWMTAWNLSFFERGTPPSALAQPAEDASLMNPGFEDGNLEPWKHSGSAEVSKQQAHGGASCLHFGDSPGSVEQTVHVRPNSLYRLRAWLRTNSGALTVSMGVKGHDVPLRSLATPRVVWTMLEVPFATGPTATEATVFVQAHAQAWGDDFAVEYVGPATVRSMASSTNTIEQPQARVPATEFGISQLPNQRMDWLLDQKFGMFIHWGLYAGPGRGEWVMENEAIPPDKYRKFATPESGDEYFAADRFDPKAWAKLAKDAGMRWLCLTARHHDGYSLFDVPHPNAFTSVQTHKRDFVAEYVAAVREAGLGVGIYYSPLSWRYPGYFDPTGTDCKRNRWGYKNDPAHHENARIMKEENYVAVKQLMTKYGHIDHIYWDGGWLSLRGSDADAAYFHEPGRYLDPENSWPISEEYQDIDPVTGKAWGIMGMVRHYQPDAITNPRYGWMGDIGEEEGGDPIVGPLRTVQLCDKNLSIHPGWGYAKDAIQHGQCMTRDEVIRMLADCTIRNMTMLLNVGPDRHGEIPPLVQGRLREVGAWLEKAGEAIYNTRGGPWDPEDGKHGYSRKGDTIYIHIFKDQPGDTFTLPPVGPLTPIKCWEVVSGRTLSFSQAPNRAVTISGIDRTISPPDTIVGVRFDMDVMTHALPRE